MQDKSSKATGSGGEDFKKFSPSMGMAAILVMWSNPFVQNYIPIHPLAFIWTLVSNDQTVSEKKKI